MFKLSSVKRSGWFNVRCYIVPVAENQPVLWDKQTPIASPLNMVRFFFLSFLFFSFYEYISPDRHGKCTHATISTPPQTTTGSHHRLGKTLRTCELFVGGKIISFWKRWSSENLGLTLCLFLRLSVLKEKMYSWILLIIVLICFSVFLMSFALKYS